MKIIEKTADMQYILDDLENGLTIFIKFEDLNLDLLQPILNIKLDSLADGLQIDSYYSRFLHRGIDRLIAVREMTYNVEIIISIYAVDLITTIITAFTELNKFFKNKGFAKVDNMKCVKLSVDGTICAITDGYKIYALSYNRNLHSQFTNAPVYLTTNQLIAGLQALKIQ